MRWTWRTLLAVALSFCLLASFYLMSSSRDKHVCPQQQQITFEPRADDSQLRRNRELEEDPVRRACVNRCVESGGSCCVQSAEPQGASRNSKAQLTKGQISQLERFDTGSCRQAKA